MKVFFFILASILAFAEDAKAPRHLNVEQQRDLSEAVARTNELYASYLQEKDQTQSLFNSLKVYCGSELYINKERHWDCVTTGGQK